MNLNSLRKHNILGENKGFYVEAGANDGITNSLSFELEKLGWRGILIDPIKANIDNCKKNRADNNIFINCALVSDDYKNDTIKGNFNLPAGLNSAKSKVETLVNLWPPKNKSKADTEVKALKFRDIYQDKIDLFILDVEGYELEVLKGTDFTISPTFFIIEIRKDYNLKSIINFMYNKGYKFLEDLDHTPVNISLCNFLFKKVSDFPNIVEKDVENMYWDFLINNSITIRVGDNIDFKNKINKNDINHFFKRIFCNNFTIYQTSYGNFIVFSNNIEKINKTLKTYQHIRINHCNINIELTKSF